MVLFRDIIDANDMLDRCTLFIYFEKLGGTNYLVTNITHTIASTTMNMTMPPRDSEVMAPLNA